VLGLSEVCCCVLVSCKGVVSCSTLTSVCKGYDTTAETVVYTLTYSYTLVTGTSATTGTTGCCCTACSSLTYCLTYGF